MRQLPQAERYLRAGKWLEKPFPLSHTLRDRTIGMVGMGRIGKAIARRIEAFGVPIVYHSRKPAAGVSYKHYPDLVAMARDVDVLIVIVPGGAGTKNMINAEVLKALGPNGILINVARGSVVDEPALIEALKSKTILSAGLDVFAEEPRVPKDLIEMDHVVLLPHVGSALALHAARHGSASRRQPRLVGQGGGPAHAGAGNALAAEAEIASALHVVRLMFAC